MPLAGAPLPAAKREQAVVRMTAPSAPACAATRHRKRSGRAGRPAGQHATGRQNRLVRTANRAQSAGGWMLRPACPCTRPCKRSARRPHAQMRTFSSFISMISRWAAASRSTPAPPCGACDTGRRRRFQRGSRMSRGRTGQDRWLAVLGARTQCDRECLQAAAGLPVTAPKSPRA